MMNILLTPYDGAILGPIAKLLGVIMDAIYMFMYNIFGIENVGLSIILFTIVIYTLMLPLTYKQQKFSKLSQAMQPELKAIQEKYKNKKDEASQMAMSNETQMVYDKYGVSPMGSCGQMLIQMPILLTLYRVFYNVPAYITAVRDKFVVIADEIMAYDGFADIMTKITTDYKVNTGVTPNFVVSDTNTIDQVRNYIIDVIYKVPSIDSLVKPNADGEVYFTSLDSVTEIINSGVKEFHEFNLFFGLNISDTPWNIITDNFSAGNFILMFAALMIPFLSWLTQVVSLKLMPTANNDKNNQNDMMAQQMKMMNKTMPLMSLFFCFTLPVGLGIYWTISAGYRCVQQLVINKIISNMSLDDIIEKNKEKAKQKQEKRGVYENQIREAAAMKTRTIESKANIGNYADVDSDAYNNANKIYKPGSMASKANMVREYNERNSRK
ncbi:MAG: YidC/Oxa1 family membrane protein insertase [Agathobacter sp.]|nr:YidC/Oxa1 family membrane protein insertase [Agathobacter sp.]MBQ6996710.1 YidC/Oxa1 family membrane protein insertase [Lachnospiraceae bacterium]